jgi:hypothetical protein
LCFNKGSYRLAAGSLHGTVEQGAGTVVIGPGEIIANLPCWFPGSALS